MDDLSALVEKSVSMKSISLVLWAKIFVDTWWIDHLSGDVLWARNLCLCYVSRLVLWAQIFVDTYELISNQIVVLWAQIFVDTFELISNQA